MSRHQLLITDDRNRVIGHADLDENPDGRCIIAVDGQPPWIGPRSALIRQAGTLRHVDSHEHDPAGRRVAALVRHMTEAVS